ncbi:MAG: hydroxymethylpyrimidine/phosphomethylpyrimidine kinase [Actinobacteria bacterium]|nr:hydroxymethylpyrimidine/phosphomethylpyrimidine kinase [Actinomycetota bacterium]
MKTALTIAGTDSSGGAGVTADFRTFAAHGVWGVCAVTAVTAQDARGVHGVEAVSPDTLAAQIAAASPDAAKTGMLPSVAAVDAVLRTLPAGVPLVVDPVLHATTGERLSVVPPELVARATVVTPNREEAAALTGVSDQAEAAGLLLRMGARVAMVTGSETARDCVATGNGIIWLDGVHVDAPNTHGTGCVLSAAITAELANGMDPVDACVAAKHFVERALADRWPFFPAFPAPGRS